MKRKGMNRIIAAMAAAVMVVSSVPVNGPAAAKAEKRESVNLLKLWYDEPASQGNLILSAGSFGTTAEDNRWQQRTIPIGNSYMGANVYGEITNEKLTFNQKTLWNGGPSTSRPNYNGGNKTTVNGKPMAEAYQEVVQAFKNGSDNASSLCDAYLTGESDGYGAYQSWGDICLTFQGALAGTPETSGYERNLDLTTGIANVDFTSGSTDYHREYFISYPDNVLVIRLTADGSDRMDLNVKFPVDNEVSSASLGKDVTYTVDAQAGTIVTAGQLKDNQMKMNSMLKVVTSGAMTANADGQSLDIAGAQEAVIYVNAGTDYKNDYPTYRSGESEEALAERVADVVAKASGKGFESVKETYLADYQGLFGRVSLDLGQSSLTSLEKTTDDLLAAYKSGRATDAEKRLLEVLLYQHGRYLTIASSRAGDLPSNLQGVWQNRAGSASYVPWGSDYHINVNLQMNYWPVYSANLAECATPLVDYVDSLRKPGRKTVEIYYGIKSENGEENGFTAHTQNTPFGWTCPGWDFSWGWSPAAVPWILQNCWEYYEYTGDVDYMREHIYPMLKEEAVLYDQILVDSGVAITLEDGTPSTRLVSAPTYSPEHGPYTLGNVFEQVLIWQLYEDVITAARTLGVDADLVENWEATQKRLAPIEVGESGQIKEWYHETTLGSVGQRGHRHMSHLLGLFPGDLISVDNDEYMDAAVVSLQDRGYSSTGWGMGQRINTWARTGDGNTAHLLIQNLFRDGIYPNLWDTHPPFQIDGNFGYTSGVDEMLMQSNMGYINLLPALPDAWDTGSVDGIVARGNFEIGIDWADGAAVSADILSNNGGTCTVQYPSIRSAVVKDSKGNTVDTEAISKNRISFESVKGETYTITGFEKPFIAEEVEKISKEGWTAFAGSEQNSGTDGPASWAIDDDTSTWWHSNWSNNDLKPDFVNNLRNDYTIDFGRDVQFNRFEYQPRTPKEGNGYITGYELYYSTTADGDDFKELASGTDWAYDDSAKIVDLQELLTARRLKIVARATNGAEGTNRHISAAEFNVYKITRNTPVDPDHTELDSAVSIAEKKNLDSYTADSAEAFRQALNKAKEVLSWGDATQKEIDQALAALQKAENGLTKKPIDPEPGRQEAAAQLAEAVKMEQAQKLELSGYTEESARAYSKALTDAEKLLADASATKEQLKSALDALQAAKKGLVRRTETPETPETPKTQIPAAGKTYDVGAFRYKVTKSAASGGTAAVVKFLKKNGKTAKIRPTVKLDGITFRITSVAAKAFRKNKKLKSVIIGKNVTNIGKQSFFQCAALKNITLKGSKAPVIGRKAFKGTKASCKVRYPKKMKKSQIKKLKNRMKKAGISKKAVYKAG